MKSIENCLYRQEYVALKLTLFLLFIFIALSFGFFSCHRDWEENNDFLISIDSIKVPSVVNQGVLFDIQFYGTIGFSDCYSFKTFNRTLRGSVLTIECYGTFTDNNGKCADRLVTMDGNLMNVTILVPGTYMVVVKQPGSSTIVKEIEVK
jgi:hypothetical protein